MLQIDTIMLQNPNKFEKQHACKLYNELTDKSLSLKAFEKEYFVNLVERVSAYVQKQA